MVFPVAAAMRADMVMTFIIVDDLPLAFYLQITFLQAVEACWAL